MSNLKNRRPNSRSKLKINNQIRQRELGHRKRFRLSASTFKSRWIARFQLGQRMIYCFWQLVVSVSKSSVSSPSHKLAFEISRFWIDKLESSKIYKTALSEQNKRNGFCAIWLIWLLCQRLCLQEKIRSYEIFYTRASFFCFLKCEWNLVIEEALCLFEYWQNSTK
jgi:hypothetical protein